jgi:ABC-2 type transport system permease protein
VNPTLFKATAKSNLTLVVVFMFLMFMYLSIIISMFDPESADGTIATIEALPKELVSAMGLSEASTTLTSFIANFYYSFVAILFPMIFCIIVANRLVARHVDTGSMAYLLSTPNSRLTILTTQALYLVASVTALFGLTTIAGIAVSQAMFAGQLDIRGFLRLNLITTLIFYAISGICFFFSCLFDEVKHSLAFGAGIPVASFVLNMLAKVSGRYVWIRNFTLFTLLNPTQILAGGSSIAPAVIIPTGIALITYAGGAVLFNRRSLPL